MSNKSNEERKKEFLKMKTAYRNFFETFKEKNTQIEAEIKAFDVVENENVKLVLCKN
jgi:hypothetical protein